MLGSDLSLFEFDLLSRTQPANRMHKTIISFAKMLNIKKNFVIGKYVINHELSRSA